MGSCGFWSQGLSAKTNCSNENTLVNHKSVHVCGINCCTWYSLSKLLSPSECICCTWSLKLMILIGFIRSVTIEEKKHTKTYMYVSVRMTVHFRKYFHCYTTNEVKDIFRMVLLIHYKATCVFCIFREVICFMKEEFLKAFPLALQTYIRKEYGTMLSWLLHKFYDQPVNLSSISCWISTIHCNYPNIHPLTTGKLYMI